MSRPHLPRRPYPWEELLSDEAQERICALSGKAGIDDVAYALARHLSGLLTARTHIATETWVVVLRRAAAYLAEKGRAKRS